MPLLLRTRLCVCVCLKVSQDIYQLIKSLNSYVMDPH